MIHASRIKAILVSTVITEGAFIAVAFGAYGGLPEHAPALAERDSRLTTIRNVRAIAPPVAVAPGDAFNSTRILVRWKPGTAPAARQADPAKGRALLKEYHVVDGLQLVRVRPGDVPTALAAYRADPNVSYAEPDFVVHADVIPNDPSFNQLWGLRNTGQTVDGDPGTTGADIRAVQAWNSWRGAPSFRIAVIDTGVDYNHPDLAANIWTNPGEIPGNFLDDDGNGYVDDVHGYDFFNDDSDPMDDHYHGTHVAGTIGAVGNNNLGVVGVNWQCKIVALKFLSASGSGSISDAISCVEYAVRNNIRLSNNSWGGGGYSQSMYDAIAAGQGIGHLFIAAAGNSGTNNDISPHFPSSYNLPNVIAVAAINNDDQLASFSCFGPVSVDLAAPGVKVFSSVPNSGYSYLNGTSMATPHVTGVAGLVMSFLPGWTWQQTRTQLMQTVRPVAALDGKIVTGGVVDAMAAIGDCNQNGIADSVDIANGTSLDCTGNGVPDECESDCDNNGRADSCDLLLGAPDCTNNGILDVCEPDCNHNGIADSCDIASGFDTDCNSNAVPDDCEVDCNHNGVADACDVANGTSTDCTNNGILDECEPDCNNNGVADSCDIKYGTSRDCNRNAIPDDCDIADGAPDCTGNGIIDTCEFDCNLNGIADSCDIASGVLHDGNGDGFPDECVRGMSLVPIGASGAHTLAGNRIILPQGGQTVTVEFRMTGWDADLNGSPRLRTYEMGIDTLSMANGLGGNVIYHRVLCNADSDCRSDTFCTGDCLPSGYCNDCSALSVDSSRPDFVFFNIEQASGVFLNAGAPPLIGGLTLNAADAVQDPGGPRYGGTILLDVPTDAEGIFVVTIDPNLNYTFWTDPNNALIPIPTLVPLVIELPKDCNENGIPDEDDIAGGAADCNANGVPDECIHRESDCNANLIPDACDIAAGTSLDLNGNGVPDECEPAVLFVKWNAAGLNTGLSWTDAFRDLQNALAAAAAASGEVDEIWVAAGTYRPSASYNPNDPRSKSFPLVNGVSMYGGFAGGETSRSQRNSSANVTLLSGDLNGNDGPNFTNRADNVYNVVRAGVTSASMVFDGFTLTAGHANGGHFDGLYQYMGGGLLNQGNMTISNCTCTGNWAEDGAGMAHRGMGTGQLARPTVVNCKFFGNFANSSGGGLYNHLTDATVMNCLFVGNTAWGGGGAANEVNNFTNATFVNCTFTKNLLRYRPYDSYGGGLQTGGVTKVINCLFWGNEANTSNLELRQIWGGGAPTVMHHSFVQDWTGQWLGGTAMVTGDPRFLDADGADNVFGTADDDLRLLPGSPCIDAGDNTSVPADVADLDRDGNVTERTPIDYEGDNRFIDDPATPDTGLPTGGAPLVDIGAFEYGDDCNHNGMLDSVDIANGTSLDCNGNGFPDECEPDCNNNGRADSCDLAAGTSLDCNNNTVPDECDLAGGTSLDCNANSVPDDCELAGNDCDNNLVPDECDTDCNHNEIPDACETFTDCDGNNVPDECQLAGNDCNANSVPDQCDTDCNNNNTPDDCEAIIDCQLDGIPDECQLSGHDCNGNGVPDVCDLASGTSQDVNGNGLPDDCERAPLTAPAPHNAPKNRYVSFAPNNINAVAYRISRTGTSAVGWVDTPDGNRLARIVAAPVTRVWSEPVVHVGDCEIVPAATYTIRTSADGGATFSAALTVNTIARPMPKLWGDCVGDFLLGAWTGPNLLVNVNDTVAAIQKFQGLSGAPHITWVDVEPEVPNKALNFSDIFLIVKAFQGFAYPFTVDSAACPP